jgi:hypothetical protein
MRMRRRNGSSVGIGLRWTDQPAEMIEARETEVRESAVLVDVMTAARNRMRMKQIAERQLQNEKRIIGKQVLQIPCYHQVEEVIGLSGIVSVIAREIWTSISHIAVAAMTQLAIMIEIGGIERRSEKSSIVGEGILEEASMSYHTVTKDLAVADAVELTVMWKALEVPGYQRFVLHLILFS